jgi:alkylhydroperoxidase family enzyme
MIRIPPARASGEVAERIRARRGGHITPLDAALLHSEPIADGWNALLGAIRSRTELAADLRELAICRIAALHRAEYEWRAHEPLALRHGVGADELAEIRTGEPLHAATSRLATQRQLVIDYTDAMTRRIEIDDDLAARVRETFGHTQYVELTATIAAYNMVSRFLVALRIGETSDDRGEAAAISDGQNRP